jgi:hypothetical protein
MTQEAGEHWWTEKELGDRSAELPLPLPRNHLGRSPKLRGEKSARNHPSYWAAHKINIVVIWKLVEQRHRPLFYP